MFILHSNFKPFLFVFHVGKWHGELETQAVALPIQTTRTSLSGKGSYGIWPILPYNSQGQPRKNPMWRISQQSSHISLFLLVLEMQPVARRFQLPVESSSDLEFSCSMLKWGSPGLFFVQITKQFVVQATLLLTCIVMWLIVSEDTSLGCHACMYALCLCTGASCVESVSFVVLRFCFFMRNTNQVTRWFSACL